MRKLLVAVLALGLVVVMKAASFAYIGVSTQTVTASVSFTGTGIVDLSIYGTALTWLSPAPVLGTTKWQAADQYVVVSSTITSVVGAILIFTENTSADAGAFNFEGNPAFSSPAGLVCSSTGTKVLPMCWRAAFAVSTNTVSIRQGAVVASGPGAGTYPDRLYDYYSGNEYPCYLWMLDRVSSNFNSAMDYVTVRDAIRGLQHAEATWAGAGNDIYLYVGADFTTGVRPATFQTNTLRIVAVME